MTNSALWEQAEALANRPYTYTTEQDTLADGREVFLLRHPELPGCKAQGNTFAEAKKHLDEARVDYIYALLEMGLPVPTPANAHTKGNWAAQSKTWPIDASSNANDVEALSHQEQRSLEDQAATVTASGDLVDKH